MAILLTRTPQTIRGGEVKGKDEWMLYDADPCGREDKGKPLTRNEAFALIREKGLVCVFEDDAGRIYEEPGRPFFKTYAGTYYRHAQRREYDKQKRKAAKLAKMNAKRLEYAAQRRDRAEAERWARKAARITAKTLESVEGTEDTNGALIAR